MEKSNKGDSLGSWLRRNRRSIAVLLLAAVIFALAWAWAHGGEKAAPPHRADYAEYENGRVTEILSDNSKADEASDGGYRGEQALTVLMKTGQYTGQSLLAHNYIGPLYGSPLKVGDPVTVLISTYSDGTVSATIYEYNRVWILAGVILAFLLVTVLVGGKTGAKSLLGLGLTVLCLIGILLPALIRGAATVPATFFTCAYVAVVCFTLLSGVDKKSLCAMAGTIAGMALAMAFGMAAQALGRLDGLRLSDVEPLLQLRQTGTPIGLRGLLTAGIIIGALGAVMDVAMSISSALWELKTVHPGLTPRELWRSGMNIGRDMVGTMTNTLILAFLGGSFTLILYLYSLELPIHELLSSAYLSIEVISGIASSVGVILAVPLTAAVASILFGAKKAR